MTINEKILTEDEARNVIKYFLIDQKTKNTKGPKNITMGKIPFEIGPRQQTKPEDVRN